MRDEDKPFIMYRRGRFGFSIAPRNGEGQRQTLIWMTLLVPIVGLLFWFLSKDPGDTAFGIGLAAYIAAMLAWGIGGALWMRARAEVVDLEELLKLKREQDRKRRGR